MPTDSNDTDPITGLCGRRQLRRLLAQRVEAARRDGAAGAVILCELETLDAITERCGPQAGAAALRMAGEAIRSAVRGIDAVGRIEGGRFAVLMGRVAVDQALAIAARISTAVRGQRLTWQDVSLPIAVSVGIAAYTGGEEAARLLARDGGAETDAA